MDYCNDQGAGDNHNLDGNANGIARESLAGGISCMKLSHHECRPLEPEEMLFAALVRPAIKDACQRKNERLREEATAFLQAVAPMSANRLQLPQATAYNVSLTFVASERGSHGQGGYCATRNYGDVDLA